MAAPSLNDFQEQVSDLLLRHRSILDVLSKFQQSNSAVNRSVVKAITECGCVQVHAGKQRYSTDMTIEDAKKLLDTHMNGHLCENCLDVVEAEMGKNLFYLASLCNILDIGLQEIVAEESRKCSTLGYFNLS